MALSSMTGFARGHGVSGAYAWAWELKSVNAKGLDLRLRLPPGWDAVEVAGARRGRRGAVARHRLRHAHRRARGRRAGRARQRAGARRRARDHRKVWPAGVEAAPPRLDGILALKGVIEVSDEDESEEERRAAEAAVIAGLRRGAGGARRRCAGARARRSGEILTQRLDEIAALAARAEAAPGRKPEAIKARLAEQVATLLEASEPLRSRPAAPGGDPDRQQGRHPRGARPAGRACRAGASS